MHGKDYADQSRERPILAGKDHAEYLAAARELAAKAAECADQTEADRKLPDALAHGLADRGFFRLLVPKSLGGAELEHPVFLDIVRTFAEADASTAWCINQNNVFATDSARMPVETARLIWGEQRAVVTNGPPAKGTQAVAVDGGFRLSGHWDFSSGASMSTWLAARATVRPGTSDSKAGASRMFLLPGDRVTMLDTWQVNGLRGTASFSFETDDVFVPAEHTYRESDPPRESGPLYVFPKIPLFAMGFATIAITLARSCLDDAIELAGVKSPRELHGSLRERSLTHRQIGEAEANLRSADAYLRQTVGAAWSAACDRGAVTMGERIEVRMATTHAIRQASNVVDAAYDIFGADAIFTINPIQRRYQDMNVITQHIQGRLANFETAGRFFLGLEPGGML